MSRAEPMPAWRRRMYYDAQANFADGPLKGRRRRRHQHKVNREVAQAMRNLGIADPEATPRRADVKRARLEVRRGE